MNNNEYCAVCGRAAEATHHLIFGRGYRNLAEEDGLKIPLCNYHHNFGNMGIHEHTAAEQLSKMLGQALFERNELLKALCIFDKDFSDFMNEEARKAFVKRYGRSWL